MKYRRIFKGSTKAFPSNYSNTQRFYSQFMAHFSRFLVPHLHRITQDCTYSIYPFRKIYLALDLFFGSGILRLVLTSRNTMIAIFSLVWSCDLNRVVWPPPRHHTKPLFFQAKAFPQRRKPKTRNPSPWANTREEKQHPGQKCTTGNPHFCSRKFHNAIGTFSVVLITTFWLRKKMTQADVDFQVHPKESLFQTSKSTKNTTKNPTKKNNKLSTLPDKKNGIPRIKEYFRKVFLKRIFLVLKIFQR